MKFSDGTWTPALQDTNLSSTYGQTYSVQEGYYARIGDQVLISGMITMTSLGTLTSTDAAYIAGLPYTASNTPSGSVTGGVSAHSGSGLAITQNGHITGDVPNNVSYISLLVWDSSSGSTNLQISEISSDGTLRFSGNYLASTSP